MKDMLIKLKQAINPERIISLPSKVFMCGGKVPQESNEYSNSFESIRHFIYYYIKKHDPEFFEQIILADFINLWLQDKDSEYNDLLEPEEDLAGLASAIPVFLESEGSYAELGAFVLIPHICEKLLFFVENRYRDDRSFIGLGPMLRLENKHGKDRVQSYMFPDIGKAFNSSDMLPHIAEDIYTKIKSLSESSNKSDTKIFNSEIAAHKILLICDVINLLHISRINEISDVINGIGLNVDGKNILIERKTIKKYILIACKLKLIKRLHDGNGDDAFYVSLNPAPDGFIKYKFAPNAACNTRSAWKIMIKDYIEHNESRRSGVLKQWLKSHGDFQS